MHAQAAALQRDREEADYDAPTLERRDAEAAVAAASALVAAVVAIADGAQSS